MLAIVLIGNAAIDLLKREEKLPHRDLNLDRLDQNQLCYHYTMGQCFFILSVSSLFRHPRVARSPCQDPISRSHRVFNPSSSTARTHMTPKYQGMQSRSLSQEVMIKPCFKLGARSTRLRSSMRAYKHTPNYSNTPIDAPQLINSIRRIGLRYWNPSLDPQRGRSTHNAHAVS